MDKGKVMGSSEGSKKPVDKPAIERVTVETEDLERARPRACGGEERE